MPDISHYNKLLNRQFHYAESPAPVATPDHTGGQLPLGRAVEALVHTSNASGATFDPAPLAAWHNEKMGRTDAAPSLAFEPGDPVRRIEYDAATGKVSTPVEIVEHASAAKGWITTDATQGHVVGDWRYEHAPGTAKAAAQTRLHPMHDTLWPGHKEGTLDTETAKANTKAFWADVFGHDHKPNAVAESAAAAQRQEAKIQVVDQAAMARLWRGEATAAAPAKTADKGADLDR